MENTAIPNPIPQTSTDTQQVCPFCHTPALPTSYFCSNCGKKLKEPPPSTTLMKQITLYLFALLLPPLGLWPAIKYIRQKDSKSQTVGIVIIVLTIISSVFSIWYAIELTNTINQTLNSYQNLGF